MIDGGVGYGISDLQIQDSIYHNSYKREGLDPQWGSPIQHG